ncbi:hypothetical protein H2203_003851 [Taxawa tesnikishii (nom. ined.)]|nr:hypothetical protein H2203_003851 [Dothideales sp. JES 119]
MGYQQRSAPRINTAKYQKALFTPANIPSEGEANVAEAEIISNFDREQRAGNKNARLARLFTTATAQNTAVSAAQSRGSDLLPEAARRLAGREELRQEMHLEEDARYFITHVLSPPTFPTTAPPTISAPSETGPNDLISPTQKQLGTGCNYEDIFITISNDSANQTAQQGARSEHDTQDGEDPQAAAGLVEGMHPWLALERK